MEGFLGLNGRFLVAKILSKIDAFLARFLEGYLNIDGAAGRLRLVPRVVYFRQQTPLGSASLSKIKVLQHTKNTKTPLNIGNSSFFDTPLGRWPGEFSDILGISV